jgi:hypothetical protein
MIAVDFNQCKNIKAEAWRKGGIVSMEGGE